jgi:hypothetical protein
MSGVHWTDVRATIPQPHQAHDAEHGARRVEARSWTIPAAPRPFKLTCRLLEHGAPVEQWSIEYQSIHTATLTYVDMQTWAERWLDGESVSEVRPTGRLWVIEKGVNG